ncbi:hypothetical protein Q5P01_013282 [Channa striata]|uniref:Uncharacterized protein n=1 Tax=Channa striata TaxID=64152 RepID=A0AA88MM85_CHASR|nr:hypothetical protein Q5P01_013282 [Channa striata]
MERRAEIRYTDATAASRRKSLPRLLLTVWITASRSLLPAPIFVSPPGPCFCNNKHSGQSQASGYPRRQTQYQRCISPNGLIQSRPLFPSYQTHSAVWPLVKPQPKTQGPKRWSGSVPCNHTQKWDLVLRLGTTGNSQRKN